MEVTADGAYQGSAQRVGQGLVAVQPEIPVVLLHHHLGLTIAQKIAKADDGRLLPTVPPTMPANDAVRGFVGIEF